MPPERPAVICDPFDLYGRHLARSILRSSEMGETPSSTIPQLSTTQRPRLVGILGAGMTGLYTALLLAKAEIPFQILEATDRVGGRCYTHHFEGGGKWDYYDVGAMRFPLPPHGETNLHKRLKELFELLDIKLLNHTYRTDEGLMYYNGIRSTVGNEEQTFRAEELQVPGAYVRAGVNALASDYIQRLVQPLLNDMKTGSMEGWEDFKNQYDRHTTRSYLQFAYIPGRELQTKYGIPPTSLPTSVINWMETFDSGTGSYDRALTEMVLDAFAFGVVGPKPDWYCIEGGASVLPEATLALVEKWAHRTPEMPGTIVVQDSPVTAITPSDPNDNASPLIVTAGGKEFTFSHVISTVPLPCFSTINTSSLSISPMQRSAIRQLQYGHSTKIGVLIKSPWWKDCNQIGGQSSTDLPIRRIVYPSYGPDHESNVLIASYCWTYDADTMARLIGSGTGGLLEDLVLRNLAEVHGVSVEFLRDQHVKTFPYDWSHNPWAGGSWADFGPGQFEFLYGALNATAAEHRLQWAGELLSIRHSWIVGALDSAWVAVAKYLRLTAPHKLPDFYEMWGTNAEWNGTSTPIGGGDAQGRIAFEPNLLFELGFTGV